MSGGVGWPALAEKRILLGVCGGIAAYKAPALVRELTRSGAQVRVVMTAAARQFVSPLVLQTLSAAAVGVDLFDPAYEQQIGHIELARWPDALLVAPATAHLLGRLAHGLADDLLSTILLATRAPLVLAPSMNSAMLEHPMVADNLERLRSRLGVQVIDPDQGELACRETGPGRQPDPEVLLEALARALSPKPLAGLRVLVTVGPTREALDPVRFLSNGSSGRMGYAMAQAAAQLGASVTCVAGPTTAPAPPGIGRVPVESAAQMAAAVDRALETGLDIAVFAAAVADYRPARASAQKLPKGDIPALLELEPTPDILATVATRRDRPLCVGFAAETQDVEARTIAKCARKGADLMIGNDVRPGGAIGSDRNTVVVVDAAKVLARLGPDGKEAIAAALWPVIREAYGRRQH